MREDGWCKAAKICPKSVELDSGEVSRDLGLIELRSWLADVQGDELCLVVSILVGGLTDEDCVWLLLPYRSERHLDCLPDLVRVLTEDLMQDGILLVRGRVEHFDLVVDGDACALSELLDSIGHFSRLTHKLEVIVEGGSKENTGGHITGTCVLSMGCVFCVENLLDSEPARLNLDVTEHQAAFVEVTT